MAPIFSTCFEIYVLFKRNILRLNPKRAKHRQRERKSKRLLTERKFSVSKAGTFNLNSTSLKLQRSALNIKSPAFSCVRPYHAAKLLYIYCTYSSYNYTIFVTISPKIHRNRINVGGRGGCFEVMMRKLHHQREL